MNSHRLPALAVAFVCLLCLCGWAWAQDAATRPAAPTATAPSDKEKVKVEFPVTNVVLFSSGVGYFEHVRQVDGDVLTQLMFKEEQINDVLKSMVILTAGGKGSVASVTYPSRDPLMRALKSFGVDLSGNPDMAKLLDQLRGAAVVIKTAETVEGKILNVETKSRQVLAGGATTLITETYVNVVTDRGIVSVPMSSVQSITLKDEKLASELNKALQLMIEAKDTARKPVDISLTGQNGRSVRIGYVVEAPIWKTSYRLELAGDKSLLQGWAIVENTSDQDWKNVSLSLVSGRPISFIQDLYTPLYMPRPVVHPELYAGLQPREYEEGLDSVAKREDGDKKLDKPEDRTKGKEGKDSGRNYATPGAPPAAEPPRPGGSGRAGVELGESAVAAATAARMGELFQFNIKDPVDLARRKSAMLPIVNQAVKAEKVSIYNQSALAKHPLSGAYVTNSTDMKLPAGPITLFDGGSYAGDARVDNLVPGDKRLVSYAIDLDVTVDPSNKKDERIVGIKIVKGILEVSYLHTFTQVYGIKNKADKDRTLIVEHPFDASRKLVTPANPEEKTPSLYRFRVVVPADKTVSFEVKEEQPIVQGVGILGDSMDTLMYYFRSGQLTKEVADALKKAIDLRSALADLEARLRDLERQQAEQATDQTRLAKLIESVGRDTASGKDFIAKIVAAEKKLDELRTGILDLRKQVQEKRKELQDYLLDLNVK